MKRILVMTSIVLLGMAIGNTVTAQSTVFKRAKENREGTVEQNRRSYPNDRRVGTTGGPVIWKRDGDRRRDDGVYDRRQRDRDRRYGHRHDGRHDSREWGWKRGNGKGHAYGKYKNKHKHHKHGKH